MSTTATTKTFLVIFKEEIDEEHFRYYHDDLYVVDGDNVEYIVDLQNEEEFKKTIECYGGTIG